MGRTTVPACAGPFFLAVSCSLCLDQGQDLIGAQYYQGRRWELGWTAGVRKESSSLEHTLRNICQGSKTCVEVQKIGWLRSRQEVEQRPARRLEGARERRTFCSCETQEVEG